MQLVPLLSLSNLELEEMRRDSYFLTCIAEQVWGCFLFENVCVCFKLFIWQKKKELLKIKMLISVA